MSRFRSFALGALVVVAASAQDITGSIVGTVKNKKGEPLPDVELRLQSPVLMGVRVVRTDAKGAFRVPLLPPGNYLATVVKPGYITGKVSGLEVGLGQIVRNDFILVVETTASAIVEVEAVTGVIDKTDVKTTTLVTSDFMDVIPRASRGLDDMAMVAPGVVSNNSTNFRLSIRGSSTTGNRVLLNGTDIADNTYTGTTGTTGISGGRAFFVEDSILEMQVMQSPVHARYGNFTGGVVNAVTRGGGNEFTGIFRANFSRPDWAAVAPRGDNAASIPNNSGLVNQEDALSRNYSLVLGGPIIKDRFWFSISTKSSPASLTAYSMAKPGPSITNSDGSPRYVSPDEGASYVERSEVKFLEGKFTFAITPNHTIEVDGSRQNENIYNNSTSASNLGLATLRDRVNANNYISSMYRGIFGPSLTFEARWARKELHLWGGGKTGRGGGLLDQRIEARASNGTTYAYYNSNFDYNEVKKRDMETLTANLSWFGPSTALGSHTVECGFEREEYIQEEANWQGPTHVRMLINGINPDQTFRLYRDPSTSNGNYRSTLGLYVGDLGASTSRQDSLYLNDLWTLNSHWQLMAGLRYDKATATDTFGNPTIQSSQFSPRLQLTFDVFGDQRWLARGHYAKYVGALNGGFTNKFTFTGNPLVETYKARANNMAATYAQMTDIYNPNGVWDISAAGFVSATGGPATFVDPGLKAPSSREFSFNLQHAWKDGSNLSITATNRKYLNFYNAFQNVGSEYAYTPIFAAGVTPVWNYKVIWRTDPRIERELRSLELNWLFPLEKGWSYGGNWTYAILKGNGEGSDSSATTAIVDDPLGNYDGFFQYYNISQEKYYPHGYLLGDVRSQGHLWLNYTRTTPSKAIFNGSLMLNYTGGQPYDLTRNTDRKTLFTAYAGTIPTQIPAANYGSANASWTQYYASRGFGRDNDTFGFDLKLGYDAPIVAKLRFFTELTVFNVFNHWQVATFNRGTTGGTALGLSDPKGGLVVQPLNNGQGWGTQDFTSFIGGRTVQLSTGFKW